MSLMQWEEPSLASERPSLGVLVQLPSAWASHCSPPSFKVGKVLLALKIAVRMRTG